MTFLFESAIAGAFMYSWGYQDAMRGVLVPPGLLINPQNTLDQLIGDLFGSVTPSVPGELPASTERRWFIAELKQDEKGFHTEVHTGAAKPARAALYAHLRSDDECRNLARFGHFAVWLEDDEIVAAPYAHTVGPGSYQGSGPFAHELDNHSFKAKFKPFYDALCEPDMHRFWGNKLNYGAGLGLPQEGMQEYLKCMLQFSVPPQAHSDMVEQAATQLLFGHAAPGGAVISVGTFEGLLASCAKFMATVAPSAGSPVAPPFGGSII